VIVPDGPVGPYWWIWTGVPSRVTWVKRPASSQVKAQVWRSPSTLQVVLYDAPGGVAGVGGAVDGRAAGLGRAGLQLAEAVAITFVM